MPVEFSMKSVSSSNLAEVGYDAATQALRVQFKNGSIYDYQGVPESVYQSLITAESVGSFFHKNIRTSFSYTKV